MQTFLTITLPTVDAAVAAGGLFAFTISFDDITGTLFWKPGGIETVPTQDKKFPFSRCCAIPFRLKSNALWHGDDRADGRAGR